jgi:hypothetical protein
MEIFTPNALRRVTEGSSNQGHRFENVKFHGISRFSTYT